MLQRPVPVIVIIGTEGFGTCSETGPSLAVEDKSHVMARRVPLDDVDISSSPSKIDRLGIWSQCEKQTVRTFSDGLIIWMSLTHKQQKQMYIHRSEIAHQPQEVEHIRSNVMILFQENIRTRVIWSRFQIVNNVVALFYERKRKLCQDRLSQSTKRKSSGACNSQ